MESKVIDNIETVSGFLTSEQSECLVKYGKLAKIGIVEIGAYHGKSTVSLACGSRQGNAVSVWSIDPFAHFIDLPLTVGQHDKVEYLENLLRMNVTYNILPLINIINETSENASYLFDGVSYDVLFIDGDHGRVYEDTLAFWPRLAEGGFVLFHDINRDDVSNALKRLTNYARLKLKLVEQLDNMAVYQK